MAHHVQHAALMQYPTHISFRGLQSKPEIAASIRRWAVRLDLASNDIERCSVVVEQPHLWHGRDRTCSVSIELKLSDRTVAVRSERGDIRRSEDELYVAIASAFRAALHELDYRAARRAVRAAR